MHGAVTKMGLYAQSFTHTYYGIASKPRLLE